jgi:flavin reductase (DIM6/NTAB) family NADH-FMN oxidoreductase RutF
MRLPFSAGMAEDRKTETAFTVLSSVNPQSPSMMRRKVAWCDEGAKQKPRMDMNEHIARFKKAMSQFATGVTIVTTRVGEELVGITINSFASVSLTPPLVSICVTRETHSHERILAAGGYTVNILASGQEQLARRFATAPAAQRFLDVELEWSPSGFPVLPGSLAWLETRIVQTCECGDHSIFISEVTAMGVAGIDDAPLLYFRSGFSSL